MPHSASVYFGSNGFGVGTGVYSHTSYHGHTDSLGTSRSSLGHSTTFYNDYPRFNTSPTYGRSKSDLDDKVFFSLLIIFSAIFFVLGLAALVRYYKNRQDQSKIDEEFNRAYEAQRLGSSPMPSAASLPVFGQGFAQPSSPQSYASTPGFVPSAVPGNASFPPPPPYHNNTNFAAPYSGKF